MLDFFVSLILAVCSGADGGSWFLLFALFSYSKTNNSEFQSDLDGTLAGKSSCLS